MRALLIMVHGSPNASANNDMYRVADVIRSRGKYGHVEVGFMECNEPTIPDAVQKCVDAGSTEVVAVPYFLHSGVHVADDLPTILEQCQKDFSDVKFSLGRYIGTSLLLPRILESRAVSALS